MAAQKAAIYLQQYFLEYLQLKVFKKTSENNILLTLTAFN
jgi:hypothetical protein